jgi:Flp pilus assembly protein TadG
MRGRLARFAFDRGGNFGLISAVLAVPLVMAVGVAIDFSSISSRKSALQQAVDSAVLAIAREGKDVSDEEAAQIAGKFLAGNFDRQSTTFKVSKDGTHFSIKAQTNAGLAFGALLGYQDWPVKVQSSADIAYASYEIALVLDTTGSMKGGKLTALKDAVLGLIDDMSAQVKDEDKLKFAMVPFAAFVNVGPQYGPQFTKKGKIKQQVPGTGASWLDLEATVDMPQSELATGASRFQLYANLKKGWPGCVETRYAPGKDYDVDDTTPDPAKPETLFVPTFAIDEPDGQGYSNNYITSDAKPNDDSVAQKKKRWAKYGVDTDLAGDPLNGGILDPLASLVSLVLDPLTGLASVALDAATADEVASNRKGPGSGCDVQPITPLTSDYKQLEKQVKALEANGTTNIMEGVAWGNRVLSPGEPFTEAAGAPKNAEKIMIVLTDGTNVFGNTANALGSSYSAEGYLVDGRLGVEGGGAGTTTALMNQRTLKACDVAKAAGIEVYTIRLEEPNVATGNMLRDCASAPDHYFDVPSRSQLDDAFAKIKDNIVRVRISS